MFVYLFGWLWFHIHSSEKCKTSGEWSIEMRHTNTHKDTERRDIAFDKINMEEAQTHARTQEHIVYFKKEEKHTHAHTHFADNDEDNGIACTFVSKPHTI